MRIKREIKVSLDKLDELEALLKPTERHNDPDDEREHIVIYTAYAAIKFVGAGA